MYIHTSSYFAVTHNLYAGQLIQFVEAHFELFMAPWFRCTASVTLLYVDYTSIRENEVNNIFEVK